MEKSESIDTPEGEDKMQMSLDEIGKVKEKTLAESLGEYKTECDIELSEKIPKEGVDFKNHAIDFSRLFIRCFKDFRNRFKYCVAAQDTIMKLDTACSILIAWNMEYAGGYELGDHLASENIKKVVSENYFPMDDFLKLYSEVKEA